MTNEYNPDMIQDMNGVATSWALFHKYKKSIQHNVGIQSYIILPRKTRPFNHQANIKKSVNQTNTCEINAFFEI